MTASSGACQRNARRLPGQLASTSSSFAIAQVPALRIANIAALCACNVRFIPRGPSCRTFTFCIPPEASRGATSSRFPSRWGRGHGPRDHPCCWKIYRTAGRLARQKQRLEIASGGGLEWLPQENIVFDGSDAFLETRVSLREGARFIGWEVLCLGRPASGERFQNGRLRQHFELYLDEAPLCIERACYEGGSSLLEGRFGLGGARALGTLFATPVPLGTLDLVREVAAAQKFDAGELFSSTLLGPRGEVLCCRYLGASAARGREWLARIWSAIRPELVGRPAVPPRIWFT